MWKADECAFSTLQTGGYYRTPKQHFQEHTWQCCSCDTVADQAHWTFNQRIKPEPCRAHVEAVQLRDCRRQRLQLRHAEAQRVGLREQRAQVVPRHLRRPQRRRSLRNPTAASCDCTQRACMAIATHRTTSRSRRSWAMAFPQDLGSLSCNDTEASAAGRCTSE